MMNLLAIAMDSYGAGVGLVVGSVILSVVGLILVRRAMDTKTLVACHEVGSSLLSIVGTLYAVILGLVVVDAMGKFQEAHVVTEAESNALSDLVVFSKRLPEAKRQQIHAHALAYAEIVSREEWPMMDHGRFSRHARASALSLIDVVTDFEPVTESQKAIYAQLLTASSDLWNNRRSRTGMVTRGVPALEWAVLIAGGVITIMFTYFFVLESLRVQIAMTALVALIISLNVYLVAMFGYPYSGDLKVDAGGFAIIQSILSGQE